MAPILVESNCAARRIGGISTSGPGRLCEAFGITRARDNACDLTSYASSLWLGDDGCRIRRDCRNARVGDSVKAADSRSADVLAGNRSIRAKTAAKIGQQLKLNVIR